MFRIKITHHTDFYNYLVERHISQDGEYFTFLHINHFMELTSTFLSHYLVKIELNKLIDNELITIEDKNEIQTYIEPSFFHETEYFVLHTLPSIILDNNSFSVDHFISFFMKDIQKQIQSILFESLVYISDKNNEISLGEEKADVLYMVVEDNGSIIIERKDCTIISTHPYHLQEQSIAEALYFNPSLLIVYDARHLLKPEMTICLKKLLRKKVVFLEEAHPLYKN